MDRRTGAKTSGSIAVHAGRVKPVVGLLVEKKGRCFAGKMNPVFPGDVLWPAEL